MKFILKHVIVIFLLTANLSQAQNKFSDKEIKMYAKEVYGDFKIYQTPEDLKVYKSYFNQFEIKDIKDLNLDKIKISYLSSLRLKNKYAAIVYDNHTNFNKNKFNILKYTFNFETKSELYYRINGTNYVVIIKAKK